MTVSEAGVSIEFRAGTPGAFQILAFPDLEGLLTDAMVNDLDNTGAPFGPADFTGAYQWTLAIPADGEAIMETSFGSNEAAPVPADLFVTSPFMLPAPPAIPTLSTWGLIIAASLLALFAGVTIVRRQ